MSTQARESSSGDLHDSHELLLKAQRLGRTGYVISEVSTGRVYWSESLFEQRKVPPREFFTRAEALQFIHPEDRPAFERSREAAIASRESFSMEMRVFNGEGRVIWEQIIAQPQFGGRGEFTGLLCVVRDITDSKRDAETLRERDETYRTLFNGIGDAVLFTERDHFADCNDAALAMFRCARDQLIGKAPADISPPRQPDGRPSDSAAAEKIDAALRGEYQTFEWRHKRFDGSEFDAEVTLNKVDIPGENYFFGVVRDVSARKSAEGALKSALTKFSASFEFNPIAMIVATFASAPGGGTILEANEAAARLFGSSRDAIVGKRIEDLQVAIGTSTLVEARRRLERDRFLRDFPATLTHQDGSTIEGEISGAAFELDGAPHVMILIRDVTERTEAERQIRALNESLDIRLRQLRDIADNVPVLITYQDAAGRFEFANKTAQEWLGKSERELLGKTVPETMPPDYVAMARPLRQEVLGKAAIAKGERRSESTLRWPDGKIRSIDVTHVYDVDDAGKLRGYYSLALDVSERKATEEQLRQAQKLEAIGKLTGGVAHDFNNLLAVILGNLELAQDKLKDREEESRRLLVPALRAAQRGVTLTRSLLAFARQQPLSPSVIDLTGLMRDMTNLLRRTVPANIEIEFVGEPGLWQCEVDPGQLQNAVLNLVVNACDAMPEGGKLTIETANVSFNDAYSRTHDEVEAGQYAMIAVSDTGTGMPPDVMARAFEPFFTTKGPGRGTGLGLSMVYGFAKQSRGHVTIDSEIGKGTTVRLYLPCWAGVETEPAARRLAATPVANDETILVVEDDEDVRFVTVTMLKSLGYTVLEATGGRAALAMLDSTPGIGLIVTDVVLSGDMNGKHLADDARAQSPGVKILFMSGYPESAIVHHGRLDPGVDFIQKPFGKDDLAQKVRSVLDAV